MDNNSSIHHVVITDYDKLSDKALKVSVISDVVFLFHGTVDPDTGVATFSEEDGVAVDAETLWRILGESMRREDLVDYGRLRAGELSPDAPGLVVGPLTQQAPAIRKRVP